MVGEIEDPGGIVNLAAEFIVNYGFQIIGAIIILAIGLRYWLPARRYYELLYAVNSEIYQGLRPRGIHVAYPQMDINVSNSSA